MPYAKTDCFRVDIVAGIRSLGGSGTSTANESDASVQTDTPGTAINTWSWTASTPDPTSDEVVSVSATSRTVSQGPNELWSDSYGDVGVEFTSTCGRKAYVTLPFTPYYSSSVKTFLGWVSGSASDAFNSEIADASDAGGGVDHYDGSMIADPAAWSAPLDLSVVSTSNPKVTLIAPQYAVTSGHYPPSVGSVVSFTLGGSVKVSTTVASVTRHPDYSGLYPDIAVVKLAAPISYPSYAKILQADVNSKFKTAGWGTGGRLYHNAEVMAVVMQRQNRAVPVAVWQMFSGRLSLTPPLHASAQPYNVPFVAGDSSSPAVITDGTTTCVLGCLTGGGNGSATALNAHFDWVSATVQSLGGDALTTADLSGYPTY